MLEEKDLEQIGQIVGTQLDKRLKETELNIVDRVTSNVVGAIGEMVEQNILPQLDDIQIRMVDKPYLDDKLADVKGDLTVKVKRTNEKVNFVVDLLQEKGTFTKEEVRRIKQEFQIFPLL